MCKGGFIVFKVEQVSQKENIDLNVNKLIIKLDKGAQNNPMLEAKERLETEQSIQPAEYICKGPMFEIY